MLKEMGLIEIFVFKRICFPIPWFEIVFRLTKIPYLQIFFLYFFYPFRYVIYFVGKVKFNIYILHCKIYWVFKMYCLKYFKMHLNHALKSFKAITMLLDYSSTKSTKLWRYWKMPTKNNIRVFEVSFVARW